MINVLDELLESADDELKDKMERSFIRASKLEYMFFDSAYKSTAQKETP